jgi:branched-chain amino acid transport system permease protein
MIIVAMALSGLLGVIIERFAYRPLRKAPRMNLLLSALGVSIFLQNLVLNYQGAKARSFHVSSLIPESLRVIEAGGVVFSFMRILVIVVAFVLMALLTVLIKRQRWEKPCEPRLRIPKLRRLWGLMWTGSLSWYS